MKSNTESTSGAITNVCHESPISDTVVMAVADAKDVDPLDVDPLYSVIDPDALDALFQPRVGRTTPSLELSFTLDGCMVDVRADGEVTVTPPVGEGARPTPVAASDE